MVDDRKESAPSAAAKAAHSPTPKLEQSTLVSARFWDVFSPPPSNTVLGAVIPRALSKYHRRRKISVDVYRVRVTKAAQLNTTSPSNGKSPAQALLQSDNAICYEECIVRVLDPANKDAEKASKKAGFAARMRRKKGLPNGATSSSATPPPDTVTGAHQDDDVSLLDVGEDDDHHHDNYHPDDHHDDASVGMPDEFVDTGAVVIPQLAGWKPKYRFPVNLITIKGQHKTGVTLTIQINRIQQTRELVFDTRQDANDFVEMIEHQKSLETERSDVKLKTALGKVVLKPKEEITFLVEIVSGWNIPIGDLFSSDPYVICYMHGKEVHRTKRISKTLDPIWTLNTHSLFLLTIESRNLFLSEGLVLELKDYDTIGADEKLGVVIVPPKALYEAKGERMEFKILPPNDKVKEVPGVLAIRCRKASDYDIDFLKNFYSGEKNDHAETELKHLGGGGLIHTLVTKNVKKEREGPYAGQKKYRIRPGPDPKQKEDTEWMTQKQIEDEIIKESHYWVDAGSGTLGRLYVEVLGCDGLPNLDVGGFLNNKTDAFVAMVYQDTFVRTDVIDDCLSPRWLPWTQRAFIFRIFHGSSQLFLGVFDHDGGLDDHDAIGRISIDLTNLRPNTLYTVKYNLYPTAKMKTVYRKLQGTVTLRLRIEIDDLRKFLLSSIEPPPDVYVNVKKRRDFRVVKFVCKGSIDVDAYSTKVIDSYMDELTSYQHAVYYIQDALVALFLWHPHSSVKIGNTTYKLPLHSMNAFFAAVLLVERPQLAPSLCCALISWLLIAIMGWRRNLPDPWSRCKSYAELAEALIVGHPTAPPDSISPFENYDSTQKMVQAWEKRIADDQARAKKAEEEALKEREEMERDLDEVGNADTDLSTKKGGRISIDPLKPILYPLQQYLKLLCWCLRLAKYIIYWEECYISFWVATACFVLAVAFLFVPWFWILKWSARIIVWTVFGPWMKLVDIYYFSKINQPDDDPESLKKKEAERAKKKASTSVLILQARLRKENTEKLKVMKKYLFGRFVTKVPILKDDRFRDVPLPDSHAEPYRPVPIPLSELAMKEAGYRRKRLPGQQLVGDMIPQVQVESFTDAPKGKATAHPNLLDPSGPGGGVNTGAESTSAAYAKIGSVVVAAGVVTWFGVPLMASIAEQMLSWF